MGNRHKPIQRCKHFNLIPLQNQSPKKTQDNRIKLSQSRPVNFPTVPQRLVKREVEASWTVYHSLRRQNQLLAKQAKAIKRSITGVEKQVEIGLRSISDLLREEIQLTENEIARIRIQQDMKIAALRLAAQFSDLTLGDLSSI